MAAVDIVNMALVKMGVERIGSLSDANDRARTMNLLYENVRDSTLIVHPWNFATRRYHLVPSNLPDATLDPGTGFDTVGESVTFIAGAAVFAATDVGKRLKNLASGGAGEAIITEYTDTDEVVATITTAFSSGSAIASGDWSLCPAFGYDNTFTLPTDTLRIWRLYPKETEYQVEQGVLMANADALQLRIIHRITDTAQYPPHFVRALVAHLVSETAETFLGQMGKHRSFVELYRLALAEARSLDTAEGTHENFDAEDLVSARRGDPGVRGQ